MYLIYLTNLVQIVIHFIATLLMQAAVNVYLVKIVIVDVKHLVRDATDATIANLVFPVKQNVKHKDIHGHYIQKKLQLVQVV